MHPLRTSVLILLLTAIIAAGQVPAGQIVVNTASPAGQISPLIYGAGIEWIERGNGLVNASGSLRPDVVALLKPLSIPVIRFPGGILADYYNWRDGIGPLTLRPARQNPTTGELYPNDFGTDEFIQLCRALGSKGLVTANFGTGDLGLVLGWQRYFQARGFPMNYWEIGNEIYLAESRMPSSIPGNDSRIFKTSAGYAAALRTWAQAIRAQDPTAMVGAIGGLYNVSSEHRDWLPTLLSAAPKAFDFLALHDSFAPLINDAYDLSNAAIRAQVYRAMFSQAAYTADDLSTVRSMLASAGSAQRIAITEHFPLFGASPEPGRMLALIDQSRTHGSALFTASLFHSYIREKVWMANYNLVLSQWFGALVTDTPAGPVKTPTYHVYDLFRNHFGDMGLSVTTTGPTFDSYQIGGVPARTRVPCLDTVAATDASRRIYLSAINRSTTALAMKVVVSGVSAGSVAEVRSLAGPALEAVNGPNLSATTISTTVTPVKAAWMMPSSGVYVFPASSVTVLKW